MSTTLPTRVKTQTLDEAQGFRFQAGSDQDFFRQDEVMALLAALFE